MLTAQARLVRHPIAPWSGPDVSLAAACIVNGSGAGLCRFELVGDLDALVIPAAGAAARVDGLWRHTCFEVFVARRDVAQYLELNFAPSGAWAAYAFSGYRVPASPPPLPAPAIRADAAAGRLSLTALLGPGCWPDPEVGTIDIGLAAVLEARDGALGYFALSHPAEGPDFHDRRAFALTLAAGATPP